MMPRYEKIEDAELDGWKITIFHDKEAGSVRMTGRYRNFGTNEEWASVLEIDELDYNLNPDLQTRWFLDRLFEDRKTIFAS